MSKLYASIKSDARKTEAGITGNNKIEIKLFIGSKQKPTLIKTLELEYDKTENRFNLFESKKELAGFRYTIGTHGICVICKKLFEGYGNNAEPLYKGKCCDECNRIKVIPTRIKEEKDYWEKKYHT